jgi:hypothetical protein
MISKDNYMIQLSDQLEAVNMALLGKEYGTQRIYFFAFGIDWKRH